MQEPALICDGCSETGIATWPTRFRCDQCHQDMGFQKQLLCRICSLASHRCYCCGVRVDRVHTHKPNSSKYLIYSREQHGTLCDQLKTLLSVHLGSKFFEPDAESTYSHAYFRLRGVPPGKHFVDLTPWSGGCWNSDRYCVPIIGINSFPLSASLLVWSSIAQSHIVILTVVDALHTVLHEVQLETDRIDQQLDAAVLVFHKQVRGK